MDITDALAPKSDQLDAVELVHPRTFTIDTGSRLGTRDGQTVAEIRLVGFDRVWRPSKGMLDVLAACWGTDGKAWVGRSVTLYNDTSVMFGKENTGGIRISHLSHIDGVKKVSIRASGAGRKKPWTVQPIAAAAPAPDYAAQIAAATSKGDLNQVWREAGTTGHLTDQLREVIIARVAEIDAATAEPEDEPTLPTDGGDQA